MDRGIWHGGIHIQYYAHQYASVSVHHDQEQSFNNSACFSFTILQDCGTSVVTHQPNLCQLQRCDEHESCPWQDGGLWKKREAANTWDILWLTHTHTQRNQTAISLHRSDWVLWLFCLNNHSNNGPLRTFQMFRWSDTKCLSNFIRARSSVFTRGLIGLYWCDGSRALKTKGGNVSDLPAAKCPWSNKSEKTLTNSMHASHCFHLRQTGLGSSLSISPDRASWMSLLQRDEGA